MRHLPGEFGVNLSRVVTGVQCRARRLVLSGSAILVLCSFPFSTCAGTLIGKVVGVSDGDTIIVLDQQKKQHKIRLAAIDAPEGRQPYGKRSEQHLSELLYRKDVEVEWKKHDRYGRIVGKVLVPILIPAFPWNRAVPKHWMPGWLRSKPGLPGITVNIGKSSPWKIETPMPLPRWKHGRSAVDYGLTTGPCRRGSGGIRGGDNKTGQI